MDRIIQERTSINTRVRALIFDFAGLIVDTETFHAFGCPLSLSRWAEYIGSSDTFDPYDYLEHLLGRQVDRAAVWPKRRACFAELIAGQNILQHRALSKPPSGKELLSDVNPGR